MLQGSLLVVFLLLSALERLFSLALLQRSWDKRYHAKSIRFFECAAISRLSCQLRYSFPALSLAAIYIIYDADIFSSIPLVTQSADLSSGQLVLFLAYLLISIAAVYSDHMQTKFFW